MNHVYRLVWSRSRRELVVASELAGSADAKSSQRKRKWITRAALVLASQAAVVLLGLSSLPAIAAPSGGQVVSGQAYIQQSGNTTTIDQTTQKAIIDWQNFGIGGNQTVDFNQPGSDSVALNRVIGTSASDIYGHLNANGQVFLVNPNGIYFAPGSEVDVGGLVASTLNITNQNFLDGNYTFSGSSPNGVVNDGTIQAAPGGYVAFVGRTVTNNGSIETPDGATALGAGGSVSLTFQGNQLLSFKVSQSALDAAAANGGVISAKGGRVILSAQAKDALMQTVVNNTGVIQAQGVSDKGGVIKLLGGNSGVTKVSGTLDAASSDGGQAGTIETSGKHVQIGKATVDPGQGGSWLIDPVDLNIGSNAASTIDGTLTAGGNVTEQTTSNSASGSGSTNSGPGDININAPLSWSGSGKLTLDAYHSINLNSSISITGSGGGLVLNYGPTGALNLNGNTINLAYATDSLSINGNAYTVIDSFSNLSSMSSATGGYYALGSNVNGGGATLSSPVVSGTFNATFNGLGHTVSKFKISVSANDIGFFSKIGSSGAVENLNLSSFSVSGSNDTGGLAGINAGLIRNATLSSIHVNGGAYNGGKTGGAVGSNTGTMNNVAVTSGAVDGAWDYNGMLVGYNNGTIIDSRVTGNLASFTTYIWGQYYVGGLVGYNGSSGTITGSYDEGVSGSGSCWGGGLVAKNAGLISDSYAIGSNSVGNGSNFSTSNGGGLVGSNTGTIEDSYAEESTAAYNYDGGLVGINQSSGVITNSYAKSAETWSSASSHIGTLVGDNKGAISDAYAVTSPNDASYVSGLIGTDAGTATDVYQFSPNSNTAEQQSSYSGFNFSGSNAPWTIYAGHTTALLKPLMTPLIIDAANQTQDYTGQPSNATLQSPTYSVSGAPSSGNLFGSNQPYSQAINDGTYLPELWSDQQGYLIQYQNSVLTIVTPPPPPPPPSPTVTNVTGAVNQQTAVSSPTTTGPVNNGSNATGSNAATSNTATANDGNTSNSKGSNGSGLGTATGASTHHSASKSSGSSTAKPVPPKTRGGTRLAVRDNGVNAPGASCNGEVALSPLGGTTPPVCGRINP